MKINIKGITALILISLIIFIAANNTLSQRRRSGRPSGTSALTLDQQAESVAQGFWGKHIVKCRESYYRWGSDSIGGPLGLFEMKDIGIQTSGSVPPPPRTKADALNQQENPSRLQWEGKSTLSQGVYRYMEERTRLWSPWSNNSKVSIDLQKINGKWTLSAEPRPITCQAVEAFTLKKGATSVTQPSVDNNMLTLPANYPRWFSIGKGPLMIIMPNPYPTIVVSRGYSDTTPLDQSNPYYWKINHNPNAVAPSIKVGALIAKIGVNGEPFAPFREGKGSAGENPIMLNGKLTYGLRYTFDTSDEIYLAINDYDYSDNRGAYRFTIVSTPKPLGLADTSTRVELPSSRYGGRGKQYFQLSVPVNWKTVIDGEDNFLFAPEGAYQEINGRLIYTHGIETGVTNAQYGNLVRDTDDFINKILRSNPNARRLSNGYSKMTIAGRDALGTSLSNVNEVTGRNELIVVYTTTVSQTLLWHMQGVVPSFDEYQTYGPVFTTILGSVKIYSGY